MRFKCAVALHLVQDPEFLQCYYYDALDVVSRVQVTANVHTYIGALLHRKSDEIECLEEKDVVKMGLAHMKPAFFSI